jgi:mitochondrial FAD-linked sulfhydryl oxidase
MPSIDRIFASAGASTPSSKPHKPYDTTNDPIIKELPGGYKKLASGIVLDASGQPCRQCTSGSAWQEMLKQTKPSPSSSTPKTAASSSTTSTAAAAAATTTLETPSSTEAECPPDVEQLGRASWTLLHSMAASYPAQASASMQATTQSFIATFAQLYPCGWCATDFREWMKEPANRPQTAGQDEFGLWACRAHNAVNVKLGKEEFDCALWKERWRDGWRDGRCA